MLYYVNILLHNILLNGGQDKFSKNILTICYFIHFTIHVFQTYSHIYLY